MSLMARLHVADPAATPAVIRPGDAARTIGPFHITLEPAASPGATGPALRIAVDGAPALVVPSDASASDPAAADRATVVGVLGDRSGIVAHRTGRLPLTPDELRVPTWRRPARATDAVALDGAWWSLGPSPMGAPPTPAIVALDSPSLDQLRARLARDPPSAIRRLVDVSVGDVTADGTPDVALSFRRPFRRTLLNASTPRRSWTDARGLSAHVGIYRSSDLSEIWVAGTLVRPVRRLAACTGALAVAYSTLRRSTIVATSAWRWQGYAFLHLPELPGPGTPTCIDIDRDGRPEAAVIERS